MKLPNSFPYVVQKGSSIVRIYRPDENEFTIVHYVGGVRKRETKNTWEKAKARADEINNSVKNGDLQGLALSNAECVEFARSREVAKKHGKTVDEIARIFDEATSLLGSTSIVEAVHFWVERHPSNLKFRRVEDIAKEMLEAKKKDGVTDAYCKTLGHYLTTFSRAFQQEIHTVTKERIDAFLRSLPQMGGRSRNNYRNGIITLLRYAEDQNAIVKNSIDFKKIAEAKEGEVIDSETFTPAEMKKLLATALLPRESFPQWYRRDVDEGKCLLPVLVLCAFGNMRPGEVIRQKWADIRNGYIKVTAAKGGTRRKRNIKIRENLQAWLNLCQPTPGTEGYEELLCCTYQKYDEALVRLARHAGVKYKKNALRNSCASYRVAELMDDKGEAGSVGAVALESGNTETMIRQNYLALKTPEEAAEWFGILPERKKVIAMPGAKVA